MVSKFIQGCPSAHHVDALGIIEPGGVTYEQVITQLDLLNFTNRYLNRCGDIFDM